MVAVANGSAYVPWPNSSGGVPRRTLPDGTFTRSRETLGDKATVTTSIIEAESRGGSEAIISA